MCKIILGRLKNSNVSCIKSFPHLIKNKLKVMKCKTSDERRSLKKIPISVLSVLKLLSIGSGCRLYFFYFGRTVNKGLPKGSLYCELWILIKRK